MSGQGSMTFITRDVGTCLQARVRFILDKLIKEIGTVEGRVYYGSS